MSKPRFDTTKRETTRKGNLQILYSDVKYMPKRNLQISCFDAIHVKRNLLISCSDVLHTPRFVLRLMVQFYTVLLQIAFAHHVNITCSNSCIISPGIYTTRNAPGTTCRIWYLNPPPYPCARGPTNRSNMFHAFAYNDTRYPIPVHKAVV